MKTVFTVVLISIIGKCIEIISGYLEGVSFIWIIASADILLLAVVLVRVGAVSLLESTAVYDPDRVLKRKKPFYANKIRWSHIREKASLHKFGQDRFNSVVNFIKPYYFTDMKIDYAQDEKWRSLLN